MCTAGRSHPATTPSRMGGTLTPKLTTSQDSSLCLTIGASLFPMGSKNEMKAEAVKKCGQNTKKKKNKKKKKKEKE